MLVNFFWGDFLVTCRSEWGHFKTPEGGETLANFLAACRPQFFDFLTPKRRGNACQFFFWCPLVPFRFQTGPFQCQTRLNLAPERSIFGFAECRVALQFSSAPGARYHKPPPQTTATNHHRQPPPTTTANHCQSRASFADGALARVAVFVRRKLWQLASQRPTKSR